MRILNPEGEENWVEEIPPHGRKGPETRKVILFRDHGHSGSANRDWGENLWRRPTTLGDHLIQNKRRLKGDQIYLNQ